MLNLQFGKAGQLKTLLLLGAHCDDIEIGCGATILHLLKSFPDIRVHWIVFSSNEIRKTEALAGANRFLNQHPYQKVVINDFRNGYFPQVGDQIKDYFEQLKKDVEPDLIMTHYRNDLHQDHRVISELTWNTFRSHLILEYEILKYDGDIGNPNFYVPLTIEERNTKVDIIMDVYESQKHRQWFTADTFTSLMRIRGVEANAEHGFAEAFYARKCSL